MKLTVKSTLLITSVELTVFAFVSCFENFEAKIDKICKLVPKKPRKSR